MLHRLLKTSKALAWEIERLSCEPLEEPFRHAVFYESNIVSALETCLPWAGKGELIEQHTSMHRQKFSIRKLHGLWAGKAEYDDKYPDLLAYSHKLTPGYALKNRIGYQTDEDFERNCQYIRQHKQHISGTDDGEFRVYHRVWDDRYFLMNIDGAHHLAAIYRQCLEQDRDFPIDAYLEKHTLNKRSCQHIVDNSYLVLLSKDCALKLMPLLSDYGYFPPPYHCEYAREKSLLCLSRKFDKAEMMYRAIVTSLSRKSCFDVSSWLDSLL